MSRQNKRQNKALGKICAAVGSRAFGWTVDVLIAACILFQDLREFELFGAPLYKWLLLLTCGALLFKHFLLKKKIGGWLPIVLGALCLLFIYSWIVCRDTTIIVPAIFLVVEVVAFVLYIKDCSNKNNLINRFFRIILVTSVVLAVIGFAQMISYNLGWKWLYGSMTQFEFYLAEGRMTSIYSEPAHLCAIFGAGVFVSFYYLATTQKAKYCAISAGLTLAGLMTGSVVTYVGVAVCFVSFFVYYFIARKKDGLNSGLRLAVGVLMCGAITVIYFAAFSQDSILNSMNNKLGGLSNNDSYGAAESIGRSSSNLKNKADAGGAKRAGVVVDTSSGKSLAVIQEQLNNQTNYAIKSNMNIAVEKMKDGYLLGTGIFSHIVFYDGYMERLYPNGYLRINYADACCMPIRVLSEFGIVGLIVFCVLLLSALIKGIREKDVLLIFMLTVFVVQSMRLGEYNWVLNCICFVYVVYALLAFYKKKDNQ